MEEPQSPLTIAQALEGKTVLLTGATGFLGKTILAALLGDLPGTGPVRVLLRAADDEAAKRRLREEVLTAPVFGGADHSAAVASGHLTAIAGDVMRERLGRHDLTHLFGVDVVIHCAASVSFEQPLDEMIELNVFGPVRLMEALDEAQSRPYLVHVSTAYASGNRTGLVLERPSGAGPVEPDVDLAAELLAARAWRTELESESRRPDRQARFVAGARAALGPAGAPSVGAEAEKARRAWVRDELVERGRQRCRALGWTDSYTFAKAMGERRLITDGFRPLTIVRPATIESSLRWPYAGWIQGLKVTDPVLLMYGAGQIPAFPGNPSARIDLVPVDVVANACLAAAAHPPDDDAAVRTIAIASSGRNPLSIAEACEHVTDYFREQPLPGEDGLPVEVPDWRFPSAARVVRALDRAEWAFALGQRVIDRTGIPALEGAERRLHRERRRFERLRRMAEIYAPYVELDCVFDDREAQALRDRLHPGDRDRFDFDPAAIRWAEYLRETHLPALRQFVPPPAPPRRRARGTELPPGPPALAAFDVEGVVLDATVAHFYAWLRARTMSSPDRLVWLATLAARAPRWFAEDRRSRSAFNRRFYREYTGLPAGELKAEAQATLEEFILPRIHHGAIRRIRAHRLRGDRILLVTGALDFLVAPLAHLADELVAARLVERNGTFTGELVDPPLTADGRASLVANRAAELGIDLADCHAYGDSISDLALLQVVGHPAAVNPDFRLAREARRRRWPVLALTTEPGAHTRPAEPRVELTRRR